MGWLQFRPGLINVTVFCNNAMSIAKTQLWFVLYLLEIAFKH
jgi:hypothetical protein